MLKFTAFVLLVFNTVSAQNQPLNIDIDVDSDLYKYPDWNVSCIDGYQNDTRNFDCGLIGAIQNTYGVEPIRVGFLTQCGFSCILTYSLHDPRYSKLIVQLYQRDAQAEVCVDGACNFHFNNGLREIHTNIVKAKTVQIILYKHELHTDLWCWTKFR